MPTKKKTKAAPRKTGMTVAKVGKPVRIDGHDYQIVALDQKRGLFEFARPDSQGKGDTKFVRGVGVIDDITEAEEGGFLYLPNRVTPKLDDVITGAVKRGVLTSAQAPDVAAAVRNHPVYPDRDDIALQQVGEMYGLDLLGTED